MYINPIISIIYNNSKCINVYFETHTQKPFQMRQSRQIQTRLRIPDKPGFRSLYQTFFTQPCCFGGFCSPTDLLYYYVDSTAGSICFSCVSSSLYATTCVSQHNGSGRLQAPIFCHLPTSPVHGSPVRSAHSSAGSHRYERLPVA